MKTKHYLIEWRDSEAHNDFLSSFFIGREKAKDIDQQPEIFRSSIGKFYLRLQCPKDYEVLPQKGIKVKKLENKPKPERYWNGEWVKIREIYASI